MTKYYKYPQELNDFDLLDCSVEKVFPEDVIESNLRQFLEVQRTPSNPHAAFSPNNNILLKLSSSSSSSCKSSSNNALEFAKLLDVETLNGKGLSSNNSNSNSNNRKTPPPPPPPRAGQCQFSSIAAGLVGTLHLYNHNGTNRLDLLLRQLALHTISFNLSLYEDYLAMASTGRAVTRSLSRNMDQVQSAQVYLENMKQITCHGDAVTLQALSDALKITIRILKPCSSTITSNGSVQVDPYPSNQDYNDYNDDNDDDSSGYDDNNDDNSLSERSVANNFLSSTLSTILLHSEIQPRPLPCIDARAKVIQERTAKRTIYLLHLGDEAHYKLIWPSMGQGLNESGILPWVSSDNNNNTVLHDRDSVAVLCKSRINYLTPICVLEDGYLNEMEVQGFLISDQVDGSSGDPDPLEVVTKKAATHRISPSSTSLSSFEESTSEAVVIDLCDEDENISCTVEQKQEISDGHTSSATNGKSDGDPPATKKAKILSTNESEEKNFVPCKTVPTEETMKILSRGPGKRQVKPVSTYNISRAGWGSLTYD